MKGWKLLKSEKQLMTTRKYVYAYTEFTWEHPVDKTIATTRMGTRRWPAVTSKYLPHQGARECARRAA